MMIWLYLYAIHGSLHHTSKKWISSPYITTSRILIWPAGPMNHFAQVYAQRGTEGEQAVLVRSPFMEAQQGTMFGPLSPRCSARHGATSLAR
jgi:hypothetical protein